MNKKDVILIGGFHESIELCELSGYNIVGIVDSKFQDHYLGYPIIGDDQDFVRQSDKYKNYSLIISPDQPGIRQKLVKLYSQAGFSFLSLISKNAVISSHASIDEGAVIQYGAYISSFTKINSFVKINVRANIMHDCSIGNYSTIAPNAVLLGGVCVEESVYVGANSTILPLRHIGAGSVVGAGAVVTKDVPSNVVVAGVPAKIISYNK